MKPAPHGSAATEAVIPPSEVQGTALATKTVTNRRIGSSRGGGVQGGGGKGAVEGGTGEQDIARVERQGNTAIRHEVSKRAARGGGIRGRHLISSRSNGKSPSGPASSI